MNRKVSLQQLEEISRQEIVPLSKFVQLRQLAQTFAKEGKKLTEKGDIPAAVTKFENAKQKYIEALQIAREMGNNKLECDILTDLGSIAENLLDTNLAIHYYEDALKVAQKMEDFIEQSYIYGQLGILHMRIGNVNLANRYFKQARAAAEIAELSSINAEEEQTARTPTPKIPTKGIQLPSTVQKSIEVSNEIKQLKRLRMTQQRMAIIVDVLLVIILVIIGIIFSSGAFNSISLLIFSLVVIIAGIIQTYLAFVSSLNSDLLKMMTVRSRGRFDR